MLSAIEAGIAQLVKMSGYGLDGVLFLPTSRMALQIF
jgi:hypothetical protein